MEWEQPALPRVGTQDVWIIHSVETEGGEELLPALIAEAAADLGDPIQLADGLEFQPSNILSGSAERENGVTMDHVTVIGGLVRSDGDPFADALLGGKPEALLYFTSARLDQANYNIDLDDQVRFDFDSLAVADGDQLLIDLTFLQAAQGGVPLEESSLSVLEIFAYRWATGRVGMVGAPDDEGQLTIGTYDDVAVSASVPADLSAARAAAASL